MQKREAVVFLTPVSSIQSDVVFGNPNYYSVPTDILKYTENFFRHSERACSKIDISVEFHVNLLGKKTMTVKHVLIGPNTSTALVDLTIFFEENNIHGLDKDKMYMKLQQMTNSRENVFLKSSRTYGSYCVNSFPKFSFEELKIEDGTQETIYIGTAKEVMDLLENAYKEFSINKSVMEKIKNNKNLVSSLAKLDEKQIAKLETILNDMK